MTGIRYSPIAIGDGPSQAASCDRGARRHYSSPVVRERGEISAPASTSVDMCRVLATGIVEPNEYDIWPGKGGRAITHKGNVRMRECALSLRVDYRQAPRDNKRAICMGIVNAVKASGGRFLRKNEDTEIFDEVDDLEAVKKVIKFIGSKKNAMKIGGAEPLDRRKRSRGCVEQPSQKKAKLSVEYGSKRTCTTATDRLVGRPDGIVKAHGRQFYTNSDAESLLQNDQTTPANNDVARFNSTGPNVGFQYTNQACSFTGGDFDLMTAVQPDRALKPAPGGDVKPAAGFEGRPYQDSAHSLLAVEAPPQRFLAASDGFDVGDGDSQDESVRSSGMTNNGLYASQVGVNRIATHHDGAPPESGIDNAAFRGGDPWALWRYRALKPAPGGDVKPAARFEGRRYQNSAYPPLPVEASPQRFLAVSDGFDVGSGDTPAESVPCSGMTNNGLYATQAGVSRIATHRDGTPPESDIDNAAFRGGEPRAVWRYRALTPAPGGDVKPAVRFEERGYQDSAYPLLPVEAPLRRSLAAASDGLDFGDGASQDESVPSGGMTNNGLYATQAGVNRIAALHEGAPSESGIDSAAFRGGDHGAVWRYRDLGQTVGGDFDPAAGWGGRFYQVPAYPLLSVEASYQGSLMAAGAFGPDVGGDLKPAAGWGGCLYQIPAYPLVLAGPPRQRSWAATSDEFGFDGGDSQTAPVQVGSLARKGLCDNQGVVYRPADFQNGGLSSSGMDNAAVFGKPTTDWTDLTSGYSSPVFGSSSESGADETSNNRP